MYVHQDVVWINFVILPEEYFAPKDSHFIFIYMQEKYIDLFW